MPMYKGWAHNEPSRLARTIHIILDLMTAFFISSIFLYACVEWICQ